jgi:hypothetical protein
MFNQKSKAMPTLAYVMNSRICKSMIASTGLSNDAAMIYDVLQCYLDYYDATEDAKVVLMECLKKVASQYDYDAEGNVIRVKPQV